MARETISTVEDVYLVAYLVSRGLVAIPYMKESKEGEQPRVVWDVEGNNAEKVRLDYYRNAPVGIKDFIRSLKEVKTDMHTTRGSDVNVNNHKPYKNFNKED